MDPGRALADTLLHLRHRDGDEWHEMIELEGTHGLSEKDVERGWGRGRIFRCVQCDIDIVVEEQPQGGQGPQDG